jgi:hypothetical protein
MDEGRAFPLPAPQSGAWDKQAKAVHPGRASGGRATFVTIATSDRAAQARIFARSARDCHPDARLIVLVPDGDGPPRIFEDLYDLVIAAEELSLGCLADMRFRYSTAELCFALKPWIIRHLFERFPDEPIFYFDSDIELFSPLAEAEAALAHGANLVLTPHILQPAPDQHRERALLRSGSFNAGFVAVAPSAPARAFVAWWCERVKTGCTNDHPEGTYGDQKWLELAPSICDGVMVLRHPGYNFAYWNAYERPLSCLGGAWSAAGWPLRFVHYSQWNLREQDWEQYLARYFDREYQPLAGLFADYQNKVQGEGQFGEERARGVYGEVLTPFGKPVPDLLRSAYERHGPAVDGDASLVFARALSVLNAPSKTRADLPDLPITALYDEIWQRHADLRYRFDVDQPGGRLAYLQWLVECGAAQLGLPAAFVTPARAALETERLRQLEAGDAAAVPSPAVAHPDSPELPEAPDTPDTSDPVAALIAARDAARDRVRVLDQDVRLLLGNNKALRRDAQALRMRHWRDEERIEALAAELAQTRRERDGARWRSRRLSDAVAAARSRSSGWRAPGGRRTDLARQPVLAGDGPFFQRGFLLSEAGAIAGTTVRRAKAAPSGMLVFGPYVSLPAGTYAVTLDARLYQRLPVSTSFTLDVVCDDAQQVVGLRWFRLHSIGGQRSFELIFTVWEGEDYADFEIRIWARKGTPLEIGRIDLHRLTEEPSAAGAGTPDAGR